VSDVGRPFVKGHGTGNDFVLLPDPTGSLVPSARLVAALCDRRTGIGGDGVLRAVPCELMPAELAATSGDAHWFMDYWNADGSLAEMCGNGVRVFARYLVEAGLAEPGQFTVGTRAGPRAVHVHDDGLVSVDMGPATFPGPDGLEVMVPGPSPAWAPAWLPALAVDVGNPHAVVFVDDLAEAGCLREPPQVRPAGSFGSGVNVEFAVVVGPEHLAMRVHERGVGETQSCGTGACAVFAAALARGGTGGSATWTVDVPGGRLRLATAADGAIELTGPAVLVAHGTLDPGWAQDTGL
jgi:diaminopimelate epimerase